MIPPASDRAARRPHRAERADDERDDGPALAGVVREHRAVRDLLREAHAVVLHELTGVRLKTRSHSPRERRVGCRGARPTPARSLSVAVEEAEAPEARLLVTLAAAPREVAHRRADPAGEHEARRQRADRDD